MSLSQLVGHLIDLAGELRTTPWLMAGDGHGTVRMRMKAPRLQGVAKANSAHPCALFVLFRKRRPRKDKIFDSACPNTEPTVLIWLWEMMTSVTQQKRLPKDSPPITGGRFPCVNGNKPLDPTTLVLRVSVSLVGIDPLIPQASHGPRVRPQVLGCYGSGCARHHSSAPQSASPPPAHARPGGGTGGVERCSCMFTLLLHVRVLYICMYIYTPDDIEPRIWMHTCIYIYINMVMSRIHGVSR